MRYLIHGSDGQTYGPADLETLRLWASQGLIAPDTLLAEEDGGRLLRAGAVLDFAGIVPTTACRNCATAIPPQAAFCPNCGWSLPPSAPADSGRRKSAPFLLAGCLAGLGVGGTVVLVLIVIFVMIVVTILGGLHQCLTHPI